jgi:thiol-disulfide isomerase/thioredoxin
MNGSKLIWPAVLLIAIAVPSVRETASSALQFAMMESGAVNASLDADTKTEQFDFDFQLRDLKGNFIDFKTLQGKVVFLNLWATWCGPCRSEMPSIQKLYVESDQGKIAFVMLSIDENRFEEKVKKYVQEKQFSFPIYMRSGELTSQLRVDVIPTTFVIDKEGAIALKEVGMKNYNTAKFKKFLQKLTEK